MSQNTEEMPWEKSPPWERDPAPEEQPRARGRAPAPAPARPRPETHGDQRPVQPQQMARAAAATPELRLDSSGEPIFENDRMMVGYMKRLIDSGFLGNHLQTPAQAINAMSVCKSAGLPWPLYINKTYFIGDKLAVYVEFMAAAAHTTGDLERYHVQWFNEEGEEKTEKNAKGWKVFSCKATVKHRDRPDIQTVVYSLDDVAMAGIRNPTYQKHPADMLMWRALARALRAQFPLCTGGALAQGIDDMVPMQDAGGRAITTEDGRPMFERRRERARAALQAAVGQAE